MFKTYKKRPPQVEAYQLTSERISEFLVGQEDLPGVRSSKHVGDYGLGFWVGQDLAKIDDWVVKMGDGSYCAMSDEFFQANYALE